MAVAMIFSFNSVTVKRGELAAIALGLGAGKRRGFDIFLLVLATGFLVAGFVFFSATALRAAGLGLGAAALAAAGATTEAPFVTGWSMVTGAASALAISDFAGVVSAAAAA
ncbi:MAG: hypothetical protein ACXWJC_07520 [Croceibacterium sp.]